MLRRNRPAAPAVGLTSPRDPQALFHPDRELFTPPAPDRQLPRQVGPAGGEPVDWHFTGVCGGAGTSTAARLAAVLPSRLVDDAERSWPVPGDGQTCSVVLVTPLHLAGLARARDAARQFLGGAAPAGTALVGLLVVQHLPGRVPPPLLSARDMLAGVFAHVWDAPHVPAYQLVGDRPDDLLPSDPRYVRVLEDIAAAVDGHPQPVPAPRHSRGSALPAEPAPASDQPPDRRSTLKGVS